MAHGRELLSKYLRDNSLSRADFSRKTGDKISETLLSLWLTDDEEKRRRPGLEHAHTIEEHTGGYVPAESWIEKKTPEKKPKRRGSDKAA